MDQHRVLSLLAVFFLPLVLLSGCVSSGTARINPSYRPPAGAARQLAVVPSLKVKLANFTDKREGKVEPILIGSRQAAFGMPMGDVQAVRPVFEIVKETIKTELIRNGHVVVDQNEEVELQGVIQKFWVGTDVTALYWDVYSEVSLLITVLNKRAGSSTQVGPYSARNVERTYTNPSEELMERVTGVSLSQIMQEMSADPTLRKALPVN